MLVFMRGIMPTSMIVSSVMDSPISMRVLFMRMHVLASRRMVACVRVIACVNMRFYCKAHRGSLRDVTPLRDFA